MKYEYMENVQSLEIEYDGRSLDLYSFAVFQINLQDIIDKVSFGLLSQAGLIEPTWKRPTNMPNRIIPTSSRLIRAELRDVKLGSLYQDISFVVASIIADPSVIAILQNLSANVIWAIGESGVKGIKKRLSFSPNNFLWYRRKEDPIEIGANLREVMIAIAENNQGKKSELKFKSRIGNESYEVVLTIGED